MEEGFRSRSSSNYNSSSNGGILGSGVFGHVGTTIRCDSEDKSIYCNIMKLFNLLIVVMSVLFIVYLAYSYFGPFKFTKKTRK